MADPHSTKISIRGCGITLMRAGTGRPLLVLHGASDGGDWWPAMTDLAARHDVIAPEHPGYGASDMPAWLDTISDLANFYLDLLDQLDLARIDLLGFDLGGWIAAELAAARLRSASRQVAAPHRRADPARLGRERPPLSAGLRARLEEAHSG